VPQAPGSPAGKAGPVVKLRSAAGTGYTYVTRKNHRGNPDRLTLRKCDPVVRRHVKFREQR
jgi:large subunit ribosomal protein L33